MIAAIDLNLIILETQRICDHASLGPLSSFAWVGLILDGHTVTNLEGVERLGGGGKLFMLENVPLHVSLLPLVCLHPPLSSGLKLLRLERNVVT